MDLAHLLSEDALIGGMWNTDSPLKPLESCNNEIVKISLMVSGNKLRVAGGRLG